MIDPNELLFTVDEKNNPVDPVKRSDAHKNGTWHRSTNVWVVNGNKVLCQQRSELKDTNPGKWEACFGGHLGPGNDYKTTAKRELNEELGLDLPIEEFKLFTIFKYQHDNHERGTSDREFLGVFVVEWQGDSSEVRLEKEEVQRVEWKEIIELQELIGNDENWIIHGYEPELLEDLKLGKNWGEL